MNFVTRMKRMEGFYVSIAKMVEDDIGNFEKNNKFDSKSFTFEDKIMMLQCSISEKTKTVHDDIKVKIESGHTKQEKDLMKIKEDLEIQIKELEAQLSPIKKLEFSINIKHRQFMKKWKSSNGKKLIKVRKQLLIVTAK